MANVNMVTLIGRLTRDPQPINGRSGDTLGCNCGVAVNNRKFVDGEWTDSPCFIDVTVWNRGQATNGTRFLNTLQKGSQVYVRGHLDMQRWNDKNSGVERTKLVLIVDEWQYLDPKKADESRTAFDTPQTSRPSPEPDDADAGEEADPTPTPAKAKAKAKAKPKRETVPATEGEEIPF